MAIKNDKPLSEEERQTAEMAAKDVPAVDDAAPPVDDAAPAAEAVEAEPVETPRQRIARRFNEKRKEEAGDDESGTIYDQAAAEDGAPVVAKPTEDKPAPKPAEEPAADEPIIKLKVHGREIELPHSEVVKQAQISLATSAAERALADLTRQVNEQRANLSPPAPRTATNGDGRQATTPTEPAPTRPTQLDPARLAEIAEDIRNGTDEDASKALLNLVTEITEAVKPAATQPADLARVVSQTVDARIAGNRERETINEALAQFAIDYPEIAGDEDFETVTYRRAVGEMLTDIEKAGASPRKMAELRDANVVEIAAAHSKLRNFTAQDGSQPYAGVVRSYGEVLKAAGDHVRTKIGGRAPQAQKPQPGTTTALSARTDLKRTLTPQPKVTQHRTRASAETPPGGSPDPKSAVQRISQLRRGIRPAAGA